MGLLPDTQDCGLGMRRECRERFPRHRLQRKPPVGDPGMHHGTCVMHVPWCMSGSLTRSDGENVPGIPGACAIRNFKYQVICPWPEKRTIETLSYLVHTVTMTSHESRVVSNHLSGDCLFKNSLCGYTSKETRKSVLLPVTGEFPAPRASNAEQASMW